jgi:hypothetical protein
MAITVQMTFPDDEQAREFVRAATSRVGYDAYQRGCGIFYMPEDRNEAEDTREADVVDVRIVEG